ncbi:MAG: HEAT repeat domain-containing protein [Thermodesulfobacteriota bacterium]|nr:HEAT repeat domain-containing protein [Thermodesulfobacteriota bacterium]
MTKINGSDFLDELLHVLASNDMIKGRLLVDGFAALDGKWQNQALTELSRSDTDTAVSLLACLACGKEYAVPQLVIRSFLLKSSLDKPAHLLHLLKDGGDFSKRILVEISGKMELKEAVPSLLNILDESRDLELLRAALTSLGAISSPESISTISDYLYSGNRELVVAAIQALSNIDRPESVHCLTERMGTDSDLDLLILDSLAELQDQLALDTLSDGLRSPYAHIRNHARSRLTAIGAKAIPTLTANLGDPDTDFQVLILNTLGFIGDDSSVRAIRKLLHDEPENANVRFAAYEALGMMPLEKGAYVLADGLADSEDHVRIATAKAIERNCTDILIAGIRNMLQAGGSEAERVVSAFLNVEAYKVVLLVADLPEFQDLAVDFLTARAHPDLRHQFEKLFRERGYPELADRLGQGETTEKAKQLIYAVDDSRMILSIYKNVLFEIGVEPHLFEFPASAIEQVKKCKPDLIFTDLNMPEISGVELTRNIRALYSKKDLPIIMVTTQSENSDFDEAYEIGVNKILTKPFTPEDLRGAIDGLV